MDSKQSIQIVDVAAAKICTILDRESNVKLQEEHITAEDFTRALNHFKNMNKDEKTNLISTEQLKLLDSVLQQKHRDELKAKIKTKFEEEHSLFIFTGIFVVLLIEINFFGSEFLHQTQMFRNGTIVSVYLHC